ncbi:MAG: HD domain-containing phosphohydrolase [Leptospirales bacterium]
MNPALPITPERRLSPNTSSAGVVLHDFPEHASVMIIDDQFVGRKVLEEIIKSISPHIAIRSFSDPLKALESVSEQIPDLVLVDYKMPQMNGVEFITRFRALRSGEDVPIIMVTILEDRNIRYDALEAGATDFLTRPLDQIECQCRCRNLLSLRKLTIDQRNHAKSLEVEVNEAIRLVRERERETLLCLAKAGEFHDFETGNHLLRMARYARLIAESLGTSPEDCETIELAAPMHDIGKIGIPDQILKKPGRLTPEEFDVIKQHPVIGHQILNGSTSRFIQLGSVIALAHQERYDGSGYPFGLKGTEIPIEARIVAVADVFDALTSKRHYKEAWSFEDSLAHLRENSGTLFDPACISAFLTTLDKIQEIFILFKDPQ